MVVYWGWQFVKELQDGLGGKIVVESKENIRTTFYFEIPKQAIKINSKKYSQMTNKSTRNSS